MMTPRTGRPLKGESPVRDMPIFTVRMTAEQKAQMLAAAEVLGQPAYEFVGQAIAAYIERLPAAKRRAIARLAKER